MTDIIQELRGLIAACTKGDLSTAELHADAETVECPACQGDGEVQAAYYGNIDGVALGVQFYGIGEQFGAHEKLWSAVSAHLTALLDRLEAAEARFVDLEYRGAATESRLRDWDAWFDRAMADDDCEYLNGAGWSDAATIREVKP